MGYSWRQHHSRDNTERTEYTGSRQPWGQWTSHYGQWHTWQTTTSTPYYPAVASEHYSKTASSSPTDTPLPSPTPISHRSLTNGALAAAVVVPIVFLASLIGLAFLCLRRRAQGPSTTPAVPPAAVTMKEKFGSFRRQRDPLPRPPIDPPILTSDHNNAYLTGLDTSSFGSRPSSGEYAARGSYEPPPPPYIREPSPPGMDARARSPFEDPVEQPHIDEGLEDTRRIVAGSQSVDAMSSSSQRGDQRGSDPFISPAVSPITP